MTGEKAWRCYWKKMPHVECIVAAATSGKARTFLFRSIDEAGYRVDFRDLRCVRAPEHDGWARDKPDNCQCLIDAALLDQHKRGVTDAEPVNRGA